MATSSLALAAFFGSHLSRVPPMSWSRGLGVFRSVLDGRTRPRQSSASVPTIHPTHRMTTGLPRLLAPADILALSLTFVFICILTPGLGPVPTNTFESKPFDITQPSTDFPQFHDPCLEHFTFEGMQYHPNPGFDSTELHHESPLNSSPLSGPGHVGYQTGLDQVAQKRSHPESQPEGNSPKGNPRTLHCPHCVYTAKTKRDVARHVDSIHHKIDAFHCDQPECPRSRKGKGWARVDLKNRHMKIRHGRARETSTDAGSHHYSLSPEGSEVLTAEHSPEDNPQLSVDVLRQQLEDERVIRCRLEEEVKGLKQRGEERDAELSEARGKLSTCWKIIESNYDGGKAQTAYARCCLHGSTFHDSGDRYLPSPGT